jgi:hypothetical protein
LVKMIELHAYVQRRTHKLTRALLLFGALIAIILLHLLYELPFSPYSKVGITSLGRPGGQVSKAIVVASQTASNTSWVSENVPGWDIVKYVVDDPEAALFVPQNKGREAMVYLTYVSHDESRSFPTNLVRYMINHYDKLPDISLFIHDARYQWHNDDPLYGMALVLCILSLRH